jgi:transposase
MSEMADLKEQRICVKICFKLGKTASETHEMLKTAFGDNAMGRTQTFEWFSRVKRGLNIKSMLVIFFYCEGTVNEEFVPPGQTVNQHHYLQVLKRLREYVRRKRPERWRNQDWLLHHDNAPAHTALSVQRFLAAKNMAMVPHPPYSPDLAPCDFSLFPRMKLKLKYRRFQDVTEIPEQSLTFLHAIPKSQFQRCFQQWQKRWTRCINSEGDSNEQYQS